MPIRWVYLVRWVRGRYIVVPVTPDQADAMTVRNEPHIYCRMKQAQAVAERLNLEAAHEARV